VRPQFQRVDLQARRSQGQGQLVERPVEGLLFGEAMVQRVAEQLAGRFADRFCHVEHAHAAALRPGARAGIGQQGQLVSQVGVGNQQARHLGQLATCQRQRLGIAHPQGIGQAELTVAHEAAAVVDPVVQHHGAGH